MTVTWYPIIFPDRCDGCQRLEKPRCIQFCPHNVFAIIDNTAVVVNPKNCVNGCTACRPLCPRKAIEFPQDRGFLQGKDRAWTAGFRKLTCKSCGKTFWADEEKDLCWDCSKKRTAPK